MLLIVIIEPIHHVQRPHQEKKKEVIFNPFMMVQIVMNKMPPFYFRWVVRSSRYVSSPQPFCSAAVHILLRYCAYFRLAVLHRSSLETITCLVFRKIWSGGKLGAVYVYGRWLFNQKKGQSTHTSTHWASQDNLEVGELAKVHWSPQKDFSRDCRHRRLAQYHLI